MSPDTFLQTHGHLLSRKVTFSKSREEIGPFIDKNILKVSKYSSLRTLGLGRQYIIEMNAKMNQNVDISFFLVLCLFVRCQIINFFDLRNVTKQKF